MYRILKAAPAAAILLSLAACNGSADKSAATGATALPDVEVPDLSLATLQDVTRELSSDAYEGRAPGTPGEQKTVDYLIKKFTEAGLKPGNNSSEEHTSELQSLMRISYAVFCLKKKKQKLHIKKHKRNKKTPRKSNNEKTHDVETY